MDAPAKARGCARARLSSGAALALAVALAAAVLVVLAPLAVRVAGVPVLSADVPVRPDRAAAVRAAFDRQGARSYVFVFGTGRSGTKNLERILKSGPHVPAFVTHEWEDYRMSPKQVVHSVYRKLAKSPNFEKDANAYVTRTKLPFYNKLLERKNVTRLVTTGHLPFAFGLGPALVKSLPPGSVRILRLRRDRIATASSFMSLGPEGQDPWGPTNPGVKAHDDIARRWVPKPTDVITQLRVPKESWKKMNRFQRWLWYVDEMECRWQSMRDSCDGSWAYMEASMEGLMQMDGRKGWEEVAQFMGVELDREVMGLEKVKYENSVSQRSRKKKYVPDSTLRRWDLQYRALVGTCHKSNGETYSWG